MKSFVAVVMSHLCVVRCAVYISKHELQATYKAAAAPLSCFSHGLSLLSVHACVAMRPALSPSPLLSFRVSRCRGVTCTRMHARMATRPATIHMTQQAMMHDESQIRHHRSSGTTEWYAREQKVETKRTQNTHAEHSQPEPEPEHTHIAKNTESDTATQ